MKISCGLKTASRLLIFYLNYLYNPDMKMLSGWSEFIGGFAANKLAPPAYWEDTINGHLLSRIRQ
jgi:hypothetical protein